MKAFTSIDEALLHVGEFGLYQKLILAVLSLMIIPGSYQAFIIYFAAHKPPWRCVSNSTDCTLKGVLKPTHDKYNHRCEIDRESWEFVEDKKYSVVTEFDLVCDKEGLVYMATTVFFLGLFISAILKGWLADRFGRRRTYVPLITMNWLIATLSSFSPSYFWFALSRFLIGFTAPIPLSSVIASEMVTEKYRPLTGTTLWFFFTLAVSVMGVLAMHVREWKYLMLYSTAPYLILLPFVFFIPETLRWLHVNGHLNKANKMLQKMARINCQDTNVELLPAETVNRKVNPLLLINTKRSLMKTLNMGFAWMVCGLTYYGITLASSNLSGQMYRDFILSSVVEFPAALSTILFAMYFGRKKTTIIPLLLGGVLCACVASVHESEVNAHLRNLRVAMGIAGKYFLTLGFDTLYVWTIELYPTQIRSEAMSFCQIMARVGGMLAPWVSLWLQKFHWRIPFLVMGILAILASILLYILPETKGFKTAEVLQENVSKKLSEEELVPLNL